VTTDKPVELRRATFRDAMEVARVHVGTWRSAYRGIVPQEYLDSLSVERRARNYTFDAEVENHLTWIALDRGTIVGFVTVGRVDDVDFPRLGEVQGLYVSTDRWRSGIGSVLLRKGEQLLTGVADTPAILWVLEDNVRGRAFYEAQGWSADGHQKIVELGGKSLVELRYQKRLVF
jgi:ribosomal protein S18 acetylase RimI-like enzyme